MRVVIITVAAFVTLGLAAFGVVAARKSSGPVSAAGLLASFLSPAQTASSQPTEPVSPQPRPPRTVVSQVAEAQTSQVSDASPVVSSASSPSSSAASVAPAPRTPQRLVENRPLQAAAAPAAAPAGASAAAPPSPKGIPQCSNPDALGLSRIVEIDTTGGPAFGTEHFKQYDFLRDKEVVFTFDDGPWPDNTPMVLKALTDNCSKATFFEIGEHATWRPDISRDVVAAGMTVGSHTWSHKDLAKNPYAKDIEQAKQEIEMGVSAVHMAIGGPIAPFFRFPDLQQPPDLITYLGTRNIATFSADINSFDFKMRKPEDVIKSVMTKLQKNGKGIVLMHDFQHATAAAMPELLHQLKLAGYKVVHMVPKDPVTTIDKYDDMVRAKDKFSSSNNTRPASSVVKTINE